MLFEIYHALIFITNHLTHVATCYSDRVRLYYAYTHVTMSAILSNMIVIKFKMICLTVQKNSINHTQLTWNKTHVAMCVTLIVCTTLNMSFLPLSIGIVTSADNEGCTLDHRSCVGKCFHPKITCIQKLL